MSGCGESSSINKTFIIEPQVSGNTTLSACTAFFSNFISSCSGNTAINLGTNIISFTGSLSASTISATTFYGNGSNLTGINSTSFSGGSGNCIADLYVTNIHGCSPITIFDNLRLLSGLNVTGNTVTNTLSATTITGYTLTIFNTGSTPSFKVTNDGEIQINGDSSTDSTLGIRQRNFSFSNIIDIYNTDLSKLHFRITDNGSGGTVTLANNTMELNSYNNHIGIGISPDGAKLKIKGDVINQDILALTPYLGNGFIGGNSDSSNQPYFYLQNSAGTSTQVLINSSGSSYFNSGNIAIGNTIANEKLHVWGNTIVTGNTVTNTLSASSITGTTLFSGNTNLLNILLTKSGLTGNELMLKSLSSGLISGGSISINSDVTKFDVSAGRAVIIDDWTNINNPIVYDISWSAQTGITTTYLTSSTLTHISISNTGTVLQFPSEETNSQRRDSVMIGQLDHPSLTGISTVNAQVDLFTSPISQFRDLINSFKYINIGISVSVNGSNLNINKSAGSLFGQGINFQTNPKDPHVKTFTAVTSQSFSYFTQTGGTVISSVNIDPLNYDLNGTITTITGTTTASNQRIYLQSNGNVSIQYGQQIYSNLAEAIAGIQSENFIEYENLASDAILLNILSIQKNCTILNNTSIAKFLNVSKFGEAVGSAAGVPTTTLQQAYNNSIESEIITNSSLNAISIKNGSSLDNISNLIEFINSGNTITSYIRADGKGVFNELSATTVTGLTTISKTAYTDTLSANTITTNSLTIKTGNTEWFKVLENGEIQINGGNLTNSNLGFKQRSFSQSTIIDIYNTDLSKLHFRIQDNGSGGTITIANNTMELNPYSTTIGIGVSAGAGKLKIKADSVNQDIVSILPFMGNGGVYFNTNSNNDPYFYLQNSAGTSTQININSSGDSFFNGGKISFGNTNPQELVHISNGKLRYNDLGNTYGSNKIAVSDANGIITFSSATELGLSTGTTSVDTFTTGLTLNSNILTLINNTGGTLSVLVNNLSGLTINGSLISNTVSTSTLTASTLQSNLISGTSITGRTTVYAGHSISPSIGGFVLNGNQALEQGSAGYGTSALVLGFGSFVTAHFHRSLLGVGLSGTPSSGFITKSFQVGQPTVGFGTITATIGSSAVTGTNTYFLNSFSDGDLINIAGNYYTIDMVDSNTGLTLVTTALTNSTNVAYAQSGGTKFFIEGNGSIHSRSNSVTGFTIYNSSGNTIVFNIDTKNKRIGINKLSPTSDLDVNGLTKTNTLSATSITTITEFIQTAYTNILSATTISAATNLLVGSNPSALRKLTVSDSVAGNVGMLFENRDTGANSFSFFQVRAGTAATNYLNIVQENSGVGYGGGANSSSIDGANTGGLNLIASNVSGTINLKTGGYLTRMVINSAGKIANGNQSLGIEQVNLTGITKLDQISIISGTNKSIGIVTLTAGTATVNNTLVTTSSRIIPNIESVGVLANLGTPYISARVVGVSFTISSTNILDTSTIGWLIIEPKT